jgi:hypothetical protein
MLGACLAERTKALLEAASSAHLRWRWSPLAYVAPALLDPFYHPVPAIVALQLFVRRSRKRWTRRGDLRGNQNIAFRLDRIFGPMNLDRNGATTSGTHR